LDKLSTAMVQPILESMYDLRSEMVPCFIGAPGIGKTQGLYEFARQKGVNVVTFILSNTVPSEVSGIRMPDKESKKMEVFDDMRMASLKDGDILFFDEILEAPPMLWSACLTLIQDRIMASGRKLPDVFIVAASNQVASPGIIPASTRDRFQFIQLKYNPDSWTRWFEERYGVCPPVELAYQCIQEDSNTYNILTPRRVTKLYLWLNQGPKEGPVWDTKVKVITHEFDAVIAKHLVSMVKTQKSPQRQIKEAILDNIDTVNLGADFEKMSLKDIMELLQTLPEWDEIQQVLATCSFEEQKEEEVEF